MSGNVFVLGVSVFGSFYDFPIGFWSCSNSVVFWSCSDSVVCFVFHFINQLRQWDNISNAGGYAYKTSLTLPLLMKCMYQTRKIISPAFVLGVSILTPRFFK